MFVMMQEPVLAIEIRKMYGLKDSTKFKIKYLDPFITAGIVAMTQPDKPTSSTQRYFLTDDGKAILAYMGM